ncbi:reverse transcriptase domain-containing protein [Tanacetum coccineum]
MSNHEQPTPSHPKSDVRNTAGKNKQTPQGSARTTSAVDLEEVIRKDYEILLQSCQSLSQASRHNPSVFTRLRRERSRSPRHEYKSKARRERPCSRDSEAEDGAHPRTPIAVRKAQGIRKIALKAKIVNEGTRSLKYEEKSPVSKMMISLNLGYVPRLIRSRLESVTSDFPNVMPRLVKTYNGSEDPEDHLEIFQAAAKTERWAMPTWCHTFNSTLTGNARVWFDDLPPESIDSYNDLREAFLKNYLKQNKSFGGPK